MKKLTIEQKAKAYDEAFEKSKEFYILCKKCGAKDTVDFLEDSFPELQESEDERIRKAILTGLIDCRDAPDLEWSDFGGIVIDECIAWLEKQEGCEYIKKDWLEHIKQSWYKEGFIDGKYSDGTSKEWTKNDAATLKELIDFLENGTAKLQHDLTRYANWLKIQLTPIKKQGEPTDINPSEFDLRLNKLLKQFETLPKEELVNSLSFYLNVVQNDGTYKPDEEQGEQKPIDKVEPKFKVGDWVIDKQGIVHQISNVIENVTNHTYGYDVVDGGYFNDSTEGVKLWTIQDAKDGDVLACPLPKGCESGEQIFIFKEINSRDYVENCIEYYCRVCEGEFYENKTGYMGTTSSPIYPATKEQRDLLFQKMKEEGYEWDAEKKELKKISQRMVSAEAKEALYDKPAWSEEDETGWTNTMIMIKEVASNHYTKDSIKLVIDWLKSLKERYTWKPSDEQIECLYDAINHYQTNGYPASKLNELYEQMSKIYKL